MSQKRFGEGSAFHAAALLYALFRKIAQTCTHTARTRMTHHWPWRGRLLYIILMFKGKSEAHNKTTRRSRLRAPMGNEHKANRCATALSFWLLDRGAAPSSSLRASAHANLRYPDFFRPDEFPGRNPEVRK